MSGEFEVISDLTRKCDLGITQIVKVGGQSFVLKRLTLTEESNQADDLAGVFNIDCASLADIKHPDLSEIAEYDVEGKEFSILFRYPGESLLHDVICNRHQEFKEKKAWEAHDLKLWAWQIAEALLCLHSQKPFPIIHRTLSPWRVAVTADDDCRLIDFGLMRSFDHFRKKGLVLEPEPGALTKPGMDSISDVGIASDIYAYGRLLDFLLTGTVPSSRDAPLAVLADSSGIPDRLKPLVEIARGCCCPAVGERYSLMGDVMKDLPRFTEHRRLKEAKEIKCRCGNMNRPSTRFCSVCGRALHPAEKDFEDGEGPTVPVTFDEKAEKEILESYRKQRLSSYDQFRLRELLDEVQTDPGFDSLICEDSLTRIEKFPWQLDAALRTLSQMRGRALLADDVGVGKTIEAGIVMKELLTRGLVDDGILILCPAQELVWQWQLEMLDKFDELFLCMGEDIDTSLSWYCRRLIAPYRIIEHRFHAEEMLKHQYDLVILDEAHHLQDKENWKILQHVQNLSKKYFLLLSGTPLHDEVEELYHIITLLRPGHFQNIKAFRDKYIDDDGPMGLKNVEDLRKTIHQVMIRRRRQDVEKYFSFPKRTTLRFPLPMTEEGADYYKEFREFCRKGLAETNNSRFIIKMGELIERLSSSPPAFREELGRMGSYIRSNLGAGFMGKLEQYAFDSRGDELVRPKIECALKLAEEYVNGGEKVLLFSQFNGTARYVREQVGNQLSDYCYVYDEEGSWSANREQVMRFKDVTKGVLFCPGEAGEGLNLQTARIMINIDLPWDPMQLEQRIGRIQRIGSKHKEIEIINIVLEGTIEEEILEILEKKLKIFTAVIGKTDEIIGNLGDENAFRKMIAKRYFDREGEDGETLEEAIDKATDRSSNEDGKKKLNWIIRDPNQEEF